MHAAQPVRRIDASRCTRTERTVDPRAARLDAPDSLQASVEHMTVLARACGHASLDGFRREDLTTWSRDMAYLSGAQFAGASPLAPPDSGGERR